MEADYRAILREHWGYPDFRGIQREIIEHRGWKGHPGTDADGGRKVYHLPGACAGDGGCVPGHHAPDFADEGPGGPSAQERHQGGSYPRGNAAVRHRPDVGERRLRGREVALHLARTSRLRTLPGQTAPHEGELRHCGRGPLHQPMGLRLPPFLPGDSEDKATAARDSHPRTDRHGHSRRGEGHPAPTPVSHAQRI